MKNGAGVGRLAQPPQGYVKEHIYSVEGKMVTEGDLQDWFGADLKQKPSFNGGKLVAAGTPEEVANNPKSYTGKYLKKVLNSCLVDRKSTRLNSSHTDISRMPSSA